ncbi:MAG: N-acetylmuramoyl-L-alanine amidase [Saprospirales bacterium]|nr:N-acetylmuramoyl-L-alanine amidase [Saprospirales bacterium]
MTIENHILEGIQFKQTPNISGLKIVGPRFLILHYTASGNVPGTVDSLTRKGGNKSAHLVIGRDGEVVQLASFDQRAWHCGQSEWKGLESLNGYSIGIEFVNWGDLTEDKDGVFRSWAGTIVPAHEVVNAIHKNETIPRDWQDFTPAQLAKGAEVARAILEAYPSIEEVLGHDDIAPGRKSDPGPAFPMQEFLEDCGWIDAPEPITEFKAMQAHFERSPFGGIDITLADKEGEISERLTVEEARALRDWLTKILPE